MEHPAGKSDDGPLPVDFEEPPPEAGVPRQPHHLRRRAARLPRPRRRAGADRSWPASCGVPPRQERPPPAGPATVAGPLFGRLAGYEDVNDAERLATTCDARGDRSRRAPARRPPRPAKSAASRPWFDRRQSSRLRRPARAWINRSMRAGHEPDRARPQQRSVSETHGAKRAAPATRLRLHLLPPAVRVQPVQRPGTLCAAAGNVPSAADALARGPGARGGCAYRRRSKRRYFPGRCCLRRSGNLQRSWKHQGLRFHDPAAGNAVLQASIGWLLNRADGVDRRQVRRYHASFACRAGRRSTAAPCRGQGQWHPGELYPPSASSVARLDVTDMARPAERSITFSIQRGTADAHQRRARKHPSPGPGRSLPPLHRGAVRLPSCHLAKPTISATSCAALGDRPTKSSRSSMTTLAQRLVADRRRIVRHADRSPSKWPRSSSLAACFGGSWPPLRRYVVAADAGSAPRRPASMSTGTQSRSAASWSRDRAVLAHHRSASGASHRSVGKSLPRGAVASIRSEPAKPRAISGRCHCMARGRCSRMLRPPRSRA